MIYFIQSNKGSIKIGHAKPPLKRLAALQTSNPEKLILIGTMRGNRSTELTLHKQFAHLNISGEWFRPEPDLLEYIDRFTEDIVEENLTPRLLPSLEKILKDVGQNIKLARLRRKISSSTLAERMGVARPTLRKVEAGDPGTSMGIYAQALFCLGLQKDIEQIAANDTLGRKLQDIALLRK